MINIGKSRKIGGFNGKIVCKIHYKWTIWWEDMGHSSLDSLTSMDSDVKFNDEEFGIWHDSCAFCQQRFKCNPVAGHGRRDDMCARFKASGSLWNIYIYIYEMISPRTARAERRRETKTHCCIAGVKTKGKRHGRPPKPRSHEDTKPRRHEDPRAWVPSPIQGRDPKRVHPMTHRIHVWYIY